jgi:hypothetical protein
MRKGRCKYPVNIMVRSDSALRSAAVEVLQRRGSSVSEFVRGQLQALVANEAAALSNRRASA